MIFEVCHQRLVPLQYPCGQLSLQPGWSMWHETRGMRRWPADDAECSVLCESQGAAGSS